MISGNIINLAKELETESNKAATSWCSGCA